MGDQGDFEDTKYPDNDEYIPYVTAGNLANRHNAKISLWGQVTKVLSGQGFYVTTVDGQEILIKLKEPLKESPKGWCEIHGVSQGKSVLCDEYVSFPENMTKNVDVEGHKNLAKLLVALDNPWDLGEGSIEGAMEGVQPF